ncbi:MAG: nucleoside-diphosphate sugar epimerase/dehydratase [Acutalibacteraceae bacterium]|nr:nucleoside-diphosphate sugar epimerase/dehydratase [Acutalibacteraceae bacterium]
MSKINKYIKIFSLIVVDMIIVFFSYIFSLYLRFPSVEVFNDSLSLNKLLFTLPIVLVIYIGVFTLMNFYRTIWNYAGIREIAKIGLASFLGTLICFTVFFVYSVYTRQLDKQLAILPESVYLCVPFFIFVFIVVERFGIKLLVKNNRKKTSATKSEVSGRIMIIGAGEAASMLIQNMKDSDYYSPSHISIIDDNPAKKGLLIHGYSVVGGRECIFDVAKKENIDLIIFCIPSCPAEEKSKILKICQTTNCKLKILPPVYQFVSGEQISPKNVRNVEIEDLLGRTPIKLKLESVSDYVEGKTVLVTGGGGSIGSELCRQIAANKPKKLIIFDIYENNAYEIQNELRSTFTDLNLVVLIGSVRDTRRLDHVFENHKPDIVYHAAAHKHVPLMEDSPCEAIKNNVFGTLKTVMAADKYGVERFVLISTDKAVNPTNIMGASKRMCEMVIQAYNRISKTNYVAVRFGNVLGSNGSVVPLFKHQIEQGGPVTVTDPSIIRYFMTIPEAVSLVLQAGAEAKGGEIFVLDMGEPVKILDLAENLIKLSGYIPYVDIDIKFTGLRPGEKRYEELLMSEEGLTKTANELIYIGKPIDFDEKTFLESLNEYKDEIYSDNDNIREWVKKFVPTYHKPD